MAQSRGAGLRPAVAIAAGLFAWSLVPLAWLVSDVLRHGGVLTGADGGLAASDQLFYMSYVRDSGAHVLAANDFRLGHDAGVLLHPMFLISGLLWRLGLSVKLALLAWKPVAAAALAAGVWLYCGRFLAGRARVAAAALAAFFYSPVLPLLVWGGAQLGYGPHLAFLFTSNEAMPAIQLWGYLHAAIAVGLLALCVLGAERLLDARGPGRRRMAAWVSAGGLVVGWLHPWQGLTLLGVLAGAAVWGRLERRYLVLALPAAATAAPMAYLFILGRADDDWRRSVEALHAGHGPLWVLVAALAPLAVPALAGVRLRGIGDGERMLLLWAAASLAGYALLREFPFHSLQGLSIPLAVLAVRGWRRVGAPRALSAACVAALTLPGIVFVAHTFSDAKGSGASPYRLQPSENAALVYLDRAPRPGGVLARDYLGQAVPALSGRKTWVGHFAWTPDFARRSAQADALFAGRLGAAGSARLVSDVRPAYLLADCGAPRDLGPLLGGLVASVHRFGCAAVYEIAAR